MHKKIIIFSIFVMAMMARSWASDAPPILDLLKTKNIAIGSPLDSIPGDIKLKTKDFVQETHFTTINGYEIAIENTEKLITKITGSKKINCDKLNTEDEIGKELKLLPSDGGVVRKEGYFNFKHYKVECRDGVVKFSTTILESEFFVLKEKMIVNDKKVALFEDKKSKWVKMISYSKEPMEIQRTKCQDLYGPGTKVRFRSRVKSGDMIPIAETVDCYLRAENIKIPKAEMKELAQIEETFKGEDKKLPPSKKTSHEEYKRIVSEKIIFHLGNKNIKPICPNGMIGTKVSVFQDTLSHECEASGVSLNQVCPMGFSSKTKWNGIIYSNGDYGAEITKCIMHKCLMENHLTKKELIPILNECSVCPAGTFDEVETKAYGKPDQFGGFKKGGLCRFAVK